MKFKKCLLPVAMLASFTLAGCQSNADDHAADVYQTDQLNTKQETKTLKSILLIIIRTPFYYFSYYYFTIYRVIKADNLTYF